MPLRNLSLILLTIVTVSSCGCSGGKLRNLLSSNDEYKTLEQMEADNAVTTAEARTVLASEDTEKNKSRFRLPGFLTGKDDESELTPDPFVAASESNPAEESLAEYQARIDAKIAQQTAQSSQTLADVERQAEQLFRDSQSEAQERFAPLVDQSKQTIANASDTLNSAVDAANAADSDFAKFFAEQEKKAQAADRSAGGLIIEPARDKPDTSVASSDEGLSEFDRLLQAHEQHTSEPAAGAIQPTGFDRLTGTSATSADDMADFFGAESSTGSTAMADQAEADPFAGFTTSSDVTSTTDDAWDTLSGADAVTDSSSADLFGDQGGSDDTFAVTTDSHESSDIFDSGFNETVAAHGFDPPTTASETENQWSGFEPDGAHTLNGFDDSQSQPTADISVSANDEDEAFFAEVTANPEPTSDTFAPLQVSDDETPIRSVSAGDSAGGLIIPASESTTFGGITTDTFDSVQQIGATSDLASVPETIASVTGSDMDLFEDVAAPATVEAEPAANGWPRRTWFLILGCVLIAALLFLPERQKR